MLETIFERTIFGVLAVVGILLVIGGMLLVAGEIFSVMSEPGWGSMCFFRELDIFDNKKVESAYQKDVVFDKNWELYSLGGW